MFDIRFIRDHPESLAEFLGGEAMGLRGRIVLGEFQEEFIALLGPWARSDYELHWKDAADRLLEGHDRAAFFTSAFEFRWTCWSDGERVRVREHYLGAEGFPERFDRQDLHVHIQDYSIAPVSEWSVALADIAAFRGRS